MKHYFIRNIGSAIELGESQIHAQTVEINEIIKTIGRNCSLINVYVAGKFVRAVFSMDKV